jgi:hypothetical protein
MDTQSLIESIATDVSRSGAQKAAATKALNLFMEQVTLDARQDPEPIGDDRAPQEQLIASQADTLVFVLNGQGGERDTQQLRLNLETIRERFGKVHVVTAGRMGAELDAMKWASWRGQPACEIAAVWAVPQPDGTTQRDGNARARRNKKLRELCQRHVAAGFPAFVLAHGVERDNDTIEQLLVRAGALPRKTSRYAPKVEEVPEVVETPAEAVVIEAD